MALQKAYIEVFNAERKTTKTIHVQFNPAELSFNKTAVMAEIAVPGLDAPVLQFIRGGTETLTIELLFDSTDDGMGPGSESVSKRVDEFYALVKQDAKEHAPPVCRFSWGEPTNPDAKDKEVSNAPFWFTCVVESIDRKFVNWTSDGIPKRARVTVKLREYQTVDQMVSKLQSADHTKSRSIRRRERLDQIAAQEYGSSAEWRRIADENDIDDPRLVEPGTLLRLPPMRVGSVIGRSG
jgi:hypothetical protein